MNVEDRVTILESKIDILKKQILDVLDSQIRTVETLNKEKSK